MQKFLSAAVALCAAGMMLAGTSSAQTQQAPAAKPSTAPATTSKAPAKKTTTAPAAKTAAPAALTTRKDKFSYALGMNYGAGLSANLKKQSVDFDPALAAQGFKDGLTGAKTRLTEAEAQAVLKEVGEEVRKSMQEKQAKAGETNKTEGESFLAANKGKEGVVALPSGLQYKILKEGAGPKPTANDTVVCNYKGTLINGTEFDSSYKRGQPATFPVSGVIKGWTEALQLMPVGSKWQLFIPAGLAYGERGAGADIGPDATLIFEVELLSIQPKEQPKDQAQPKPQEPTKDQAPPKTQEPPPTPPKTQGTDKQ
jgi:FKBP-type peptidyl-prolyl cis-trans isomerase FklB